MGIKNALHNSVKFISWNRLTLNLVLNAVIFPFLSSQAKKVLQRQLTEQVTFL